MAYLIETFDKPDSLALRKTLRPAHLVFLEKHAQLLLACGAKLHDDGTDLGGGIYVLDVNTRQEAEAFIAEDPFFKGELFERIQITHWRKAYLDGKSFLPPGRSQGKKHPPGGSGNREAS